MFLLGLIIGGQLGIVLMCILQVMSDNGLQEENQKLKEKLNQIQTEISEFCRNANCSCYCREQECLLYRMEQIIVDCKEGE